MPLKKEVYWPAPKQTKKNFLKLLQSGQDPPDDGTWKVHKLQRLFFETDDYETAERKIRKAEDTSNVDTDVAEESLILPRKRVRKPVVYSSDEQSDVEIHHKQKKQKKQLPRPPPLLNPYNNGYESSPHLTQLPDQHQVFSQRTSTPRSHNSHNQVEFLEENNTGYSVATRTPTPLFLGEVNTPRTNRHLTNTSLTHEALNSQTFKENVPRDKAIIDLLKLIREQNNQILNWIKKQDSVGNSTFSTLPDDIGVDLPLTSEEDLQQLEAYIVDKNHFFALASYYSTLGGRDFCVHTNAILKSLLSLSLATNLNFHGKRGHKKAFKELRLKDVIIYAVRKNSPQVTEKEIEDKIKVWLKHAPEKLKRERNSNE